MARLLALFLLLAMLPSCATVISRRAYQMRVRSNAKVATITYKDSIYTLPATIKVRRAKAPLTLDFITADTTKHIRISPHLNPAFVFGNLAWVQVAPAAYLLDLASIKRFTYGRNLYLNTADTSTIYPLSKRRWLRYRTKSYAPRNGDVGLAFTVPVVSHFLLQPDGEPMKDNFGCLGLGAALSYAFQDGRSIALSGGVAIDMIMPFPAPVDYMGEFERNRTVWVSVMEMHHTKRLSFGYGVCYSRNTWTLDYDADFTGLPLPPGYPVSKSQEGIGITAAGYFRPNRVINLGLQYRSSLLNLNRGSFGPYEHTVSLEVSFPIKLFRVR
jgi:hypothetical protein